MNGMTISGSALTSLVIDREGILETVVPTNMVDNEQPVPFSVSFGFVTPEAADAAAATAAQVAAAMRGVAIEAAVKA